MGRQRKSKVEKNPYKLRFRRLADGGQSIFIDRFADGKHHYEALGLVLLPETSSKAKRENAKTLRKANEILNVKAEALVVEKSETMSTQTAGKHLLSNWVQTCYDNHKERGARDLNGLYNLKISLGKFRQDAILEDIDKQFCLDYIYWLSSVYKKKNGKAVTPKTAHSYTTTLRTVLNEAVKAGLIENNPWYKLERIEKVPVPESKREFLTIDEVKMLTATPYNNECIRNAFLFSCFTGLRCCDVRNLRWKDISTIGEQWTVCIVQQKTTNPVVLPLSKQACKWLPEKGDAENFVFDNLPNMGNLELNLQSWVKSAGIKTHVTFHVARHTFATMMLTLGVDIYTVSKLLGHRSVRATQIYAKIVDSKKDEAVNLVDSIGF